MPRLLAFPLLAVLLTLPSHLPTTTHPLNSDDDEATPDRSGKPIPDWARSHNLGECLRRQQHVDPDKIFGARGATCPLDDVFKGVGACCCLLLLLAACCLLPAGEGAGREGLRAHLC